MLETYEFRDSKERVFMAVLLKLDRGVLLTRVDGEAFHCFATASLTSAPIHFSLKFSLMFIRSGRPISASNNDAWEPWGTAFSKEIEHCAFRGNPVHPQALTCGATNVGAPRSCRLQGRVGIGKEKEMRS
jgi:hypothetical protein